jgi:membrane protein required for colicin V production
LNIVSFFFAFVVIFFAISFVGVVLKHLFAASALGWVDRVLGGAFALVKAVLIVSVLLVALTAFLPQNSPLIVHSKVSPYVTGASERLARAVPPDMKKKFNNNLDALRQSWGKI